MSFSVEIGFDCYNKNGRHWWVDIVLDGTTCGGDDPEVTIKVEHHNEITLEKVVAISKVSTTPESVHDLVDRCMAIRIADEYHKLKKVYDVALIVLA